MENFQMFCKEKDIEVYSALSKTKAAFAERAIPSLKYKIYHYIKDHGQNSFISYLNLFLQGMVASKYLLGNPLEMSRTLISSQFCSINL